MCINSEYRDRLLRLYHRCVVTGYDPIQCDAAHIIPQSICYRFSLQGLVKDIYNGLILSKELHSMFDSFIWCFDPYNIQKIDDDWCYISIIVVPNRLNLFINQYHGHICKIPFLSLPFIWINYHIFITKNFLGEFTKSLYQQLLSTNDYLLLRQNPKLLLSNINSNEPFIIVDSRNYGSQFKVIFKNSNWNIQHWFYAEDLNPLLIDKYQSTIDLLHDPNYS